MKQPIDGYSRASGLPFRYRLSSFWRQKEGKTARLRQGPADAASPKKKSPFVAPAKLALHECNKPSKFWPPYPSSTCLDFTRLEQLRLRTLQVFSFFLRTGPPTLSFRSASSPAKAGRRKYSNVYLWRRGVPLQD
jgi:hypothetical protein